MFANFTDLTVPLKVYNQFSDWYREGGSAYLPSTTLIGSRMLWIYTSRLKLRSPGVKTTPNHYIGIL